MKPLLSLLLLLLSALPAVAAPAISCHCFQDRSFDPRRPAAADPYFLATVQNSFLAAAFDIEKKTIVRAKMGGASGDALWVKGFLARRGGVSMDRVETVCGQTSSWQEALTRLKIAPDALGDRFARAAAGGADDGVLAQIAAEETLTARFGSTARDLAALRSAGAGTREVLLAEFLSRLSQRPATSIYAEVAEGRASWGLLLQRYGITADKIEDALRRLVR